jgi:hypothetical protein
LVPESRQEEVEGFIEYLDAGMGVDAPGADNCREADVRQSTTRSASDEVGDAPMTQEAPTKETRAVDLAASLKWLEPHLERLEHEYLVLRADHDAETAFEHALAILDDDTRAHLTSFLLAKRTMSPELASGHYSIWPMSRRLVSHSAKLG